MTPQIDWPAAQIDWPAAQTVASAFRLAIPRVPIGGTLGERLGAGTGSSLEFQEYRQYAQGDDLRHVDWAAYARSEVLTVRLYREEVAPRIDLVLDISRSMAVTQEKSVAYGELAALLACTSASAAANARVITSIAGSHPLHRPEEIEPLLECSATTSAIEEARVPFRRGSLRVIVSDFLFPHDADALVGRLARGSAWLAIIQLTSREEAEPVIEGGRRLIDVEGYGELDLMIDEKAVHGYRARFSRLRLGLSVAARRTGAHFVPIMAGTPLRDVARALAVAGVIEPL
jgi:uncharacterized protein (DUF58 family)